MGACVLWCAVGRDCTAMASEERIQITRKAELLSFGDLPCVKKPCCLVGMLWLCRSTFCTEMQQYSSFQCACYSSRSWKGRTAWNHILLAAFSLFPCSRACGTSSCHIGVPSCWRPCHSDICVCTALLSSHRDVTQQSI